ncbi:P-loop NTPase fold protein [[Flexibacter] sp. ATCC 35103]|uniref:KAP family P-loop NTPase fold protein n=1 Tax=[Flexibacter] sp. ATCC 35103 TaxID=1937528 RepID=UPI0009D35F2C|nr:P-loop NTPase fold protein [[Flexibacter] sp. ATCC 35103]OMQ12940.1 NTPase [[Flexibacter] sp. ATCC 35103]
MWKDSETNIDLLDFDYLIEITKDIIENDELSPCTIGVYGDWGSGKSSLVEMILKDYEKKDDYLCLKFNGWLFEDYEDAKTALLGSILDKIKENKKNSEKAKSILKKLFKNLDYLDIASKGIKYGTDFILTGGIGTIADLTIQNVLSKTKALGSEVKHDGIKKILENTFKKEEVRKNLREFRNDFEELLKETGTKKLVVFIDELDRCNHDTILETLEAIRLFLFTKGTSFIIGADERQVMYAVRKRFPEVKGNQIDIGKEYLEKMIQYPIKIPQLGINEVEFYITCLFFQDLFKEDYSQIIQFIKKQRKQNFLSFEITFDLIKNEFATLDEEKIKETISLSKQLSSVLSKSLNGNPRHCKRFLNSHSMRLKMAKFKGVELDKKALAKIMLIEYFKETVFKQIGELQANENGKPKELEFVEKDEWSSVKKLKIWKDDEWFLNWLSIEPKLTNIDLQPYYYFSRESLQNNIIKSTTTISIEAESALTQLLSKSDISRKEAIKKESNINEFESLEILKTLFSNIEVSSDIDAKLFTAYIEWGSTKEILFSEVVSHLSSLPANKIKISFIPRIAEFAKASNKLNEIKELAEKWKNDNTSLKSSIEQELK